LPKQHQNTLPLFIAVPSGSFEAHNAKLLIAKAFNLQNPELWYDIGPYATFERAF
jgi:hypothetical protein